MNKLMKELTQKAELWALNDKYGASWQYWVLEPLNEENDLLRFKYWNWYGLAFYNMYVHLLRLKYHNKKVDGKKFIYQQIQDVFPKKAVRFYREIYLASGLVLPVNIDEIVLSDNFQNNIFPVNNQLPLYYFAILDGMMDFEVIPNDVKSKEFELFYQNWVEKIF